MNKKILLVVFACTNMCITIKAMDVAADTSIMLEMANEEKKESQLARNKSMMAMLAAAELSGDPKKIAYVEHMIKAHNHHQVQQDAFVQKPMIIKQSEIKTRAKL